jgi:DNA segregation ATPase FtsK/SpoIIIE, S-DNA-T family
VQSPAAMVAPAGADALYLQAVAVVRERGRGSVIILQRKLGIGYTRAVRILEQLLRNGVVGPENASGSHPVL